MPSSVTRLAPGAGYNAAGFHLPSPFPAGAPGGAGDNLLTSMETMLDKKLSTQTGEFNQTVHGLEQRIGERLTAQDTKIDAITANDQKQDASIADISSRMEKIEAAISSKISGLQFSSQSNHAREKEAFLAGFSDLPKPTLKAKAEHFVGKPPGFVEVSVPGNVCNYAFIKFETPEHMETFVLESERRAVSAGLRPQGTPEDKARRHTIWQGKQKLIEALQLPDKNDRVTFSRRRFWPVAEDGESVTEMGKLGSNYQIVWDLAAPESVRRGA